MSIPASSSLSSLDEGRIPQDADFQNEMKEAALQSVNEAIHQPSPPNEVQSKLAQEEQSLEPADVKEVTITSKNLPHIETTASQGTGPEGPGAKARPKRTSSRPTKKRIILKQSPKKTVKRSKWTAESLITDPKSPLVKADLRRMFLNPMAWDVLNKTDQEEILALFPEPSLTVVDHGDGQARPDTAVLANDDGFRHACATYIEELAEGRHDPEWLASAFIASRRRKAGDFDEYLVRKFKDDWGLEVPEDLIPRRNVLTQQDEPGEEGIAAECSEKKECTEKAQQTPSVGSCSNDTASDVSERLFVESDATDVIRSS